MSSVTETAWQFRSACLQIVREKMWAAEAQKRGENLFGGETTGREREAMEV